MAIDEERLWRLLGGIEEKTKDTKGIVLDVSARLRSIETGECLMGKANREMIAGNTDAIKALRNGPNKRGGIVGAVAGGVGAGVVVAARDLWGKLFGG